MVRGQEDKDAADVIIGTFLIHYVPFFPLIDVGSTHPYIALNMVEKLNQKVEKTSSIMAVISPLGQTIKIDRIYKSCLLKLQEEIFSVDLMKFPFEQFDLLVGGAPSKPRLCLEKGNLENQIWKRNCYGKKHKKLLVKGYLSNGHKKDGSKGMQIIFSLCRGC